MLIRAGCYHLAAHATGVIPAYCLDKTGRAPPRGSILGETPALGEATVTVGNQSMTLEVAFSRHLLRIEGADSPKELSLINVTDQPISLCVGQPVVVMGNGLSYSSDLKRIYTQITDAVQADQSSPSSAAPTDPDAAHSKAQQLLWDLVTKEDEREHPAPWPQAGPLPSDREDCLDQASKALVPTIVVCPDKR
jgi:hypothetical protein